jgi:hypothetical protein
MSTENGHSTEQGERETWRAWVRRQLRFAWIALVDPYPRPTAEEAERARARHTIQEGP